MVYLIRHAEPALRNVFLGRTDPALSSAGLAQTECLRALRVEQVFCSPLQRARQTAAAIDAPLTVIEDLAEINFGEWEGRNWEDIAREQPELAGKKLADWLQVPPPGGETWEAFTARVLSAWQQVLDGPRPCAVVAHLVVNSVLAEHLIGAEPLSFRQQYCEILEIHV